MLLRGQRQKAMNTLAVTVTTKVCPDTEATRRYIYILVTIAGHTADWDWNAGS